MSGTYKLIVDNGTYTTTEEDDDEKEKKTRVSAGEIEINGEDIIEEDDFKKRLARVERTINLPQGENRIEIKVKGKPVAFITVSIECVSGWGWRGWHNTSRDQKGHKGVKSLTLTRQARRRWGSARDMGQK